MARRFLIFLVMTLTMAACGSTGAPLTRPTAVTDYTPLPMQSGLDWPTYHRDAQRSGYLADFPDPQRLTRAWTAQLDGAVYAEPLVVGGTIFAATEADTLYALSASTGQIAWQVHVGTPVSLKDLPCGNIDPLGITGTPVYDPASGLIFAVAELSDFSHVLVGVDVHTGAVRVRRSVDPPGADARAHQQRGALALVNGYIYVPYGGLAGDCSDYHGWVVASATSGQGALLSYQVPTTREGGIWTPPGPAVDAMGNIYVSVGNGAATSGAWDHSDSILRLSPQLQLQDGFAPTTWPRENAQDADLGSMGPVLLPDGLIIADGKGGQAYLLRANALGGVGGQIQQMAFCDAFGGAAVVGTTAFIPCTSGVREIQVTAQSFAPGWQAGSMITGSPIVGGHTVYAIDTSGTLYALNSADGTVRASADIGSVSRFATPTLFGNAVYIGTDSGIVALGIQ